MALLTIINGIPLYSTINEAINNGQTFRSQGYNPMQQSGGYSGYHVHKHNNVTGYMQGDSHAEITSGVIATSPSQSTAAPQAYSSPTPSTTSSTPSTSGGSGY